MDPKALKICAEYSCNHVYVPDRTGLCPRCHSQGIWLQILTERKVLQSVKEEEKIVDR